MASQLQKLSGKIPCLALLGPRQSGKSTLAKAVFPKHAYVNLEFGDTREFATEDPRGFLGQFTNGVILDEIQRVPGLLEYLQGFIDEENINGKYILTGSQNFPVMEALSESLAGRVILRTLLPFSLGELLDAGTTPRDLEKTLHHGFYPRLFDQELEPGEWLPSYIQTYLERDVRRIVSVRDMTTFETFLRLCAGRTGQLLNIDSLANDTGIDHKTVRRWLSVLEQTYVIHRLKPYHADFRKRLVKSPKLYFIDTGLACSLLGIRSPQELFSHPLKGSLFETFIVSEILKNHYNAGLEPQIHFWRDSHGNEVDLILESGGELLPIEIKSSKTIHSNLLKGLRYFCSLPGVRPMKPLLIYGGDTSQNRTEAEILSWRETTGLEV